MANILLEKLSWSSSFISSRDRLVDESFLRESIRIYMSLAYSLSGSNFTFDIFSQIKRPVRVFDFLIIQTTVGMSYAFMDCFIKLYTGRIDFNTSLNPLLKGVTVGIILQDLLWMSIYANNLADNLRYFAGSVGFVHSWSECHRTYGNNCVSINEVPSRCRLHEKTQLAHTSAHHYFISNIICLLRRIYGVSLTFPHYFFCYLTHTAFFRKIFVDFEKTSLTEKFFVTAFVWIAIFFLSSMSAGALIQYLKLTFLLRVTSTLVIGFLLLILKGQYLKPAISDIMNFDLDMSFGRTFDYVANMYCIGLMGPYDFGTMSPYTVLDNAVVIFGVVLILTTIIQSLIVRMVFLVAWHCISYTETFETDYVIFALIPVGVQMIHVQKIIVIYLYLNLILSSAGHTTLLMATMTKLLGSEFKTVKELYIIGILCSAGFCMSLGMIGAYAYVSGLKLGLVICMTFLGALKSSIVMWLYGVQRFSSDIEFWLGFKPVIYWRICWVLLPAVLLYVCVIKFDKFVGAFKNDVPSIVSTIWITTTAVLVLPVQIKMVAKYMMRNNFIAAFRNSLKYGPPDPDQRKKRRNFNENVNIRQCDHPCFDPANYLECVHEVYEQEPKLNVLISAQDTDHEDFTRRRTSSVISVTTVDHF